MPATAELSAFFTQSDLTLDDYTHFADCAFASAAALEKFDEQLREYRADSAADSLRVGMGLLIIGRFSEALEKLEKGGNTKVRAFLAAQAALHLNQFDEAIGLLEKAAAAGVDALKTDLLAAECHLRAARVKEAEKLIHRHERAGQDRAEWYYARGLLHEAFDERSQAVGCFEKAMTLDPDHSGAMFRSAWLYDMAGDDEQAIELYQRLSMQPRTFVNALMNLAISFEDLGRYNEAYECVMRVLRAFPDHSRARLYLKDIESGRQMMVDENAPAAIDPRQRLMDTPITDFELSVRSRNCLKKMKIHTLGELIKLSEPELLAFKNFGETSLNEIKALLLKKGLRLGQSPEEVAAAPAPEPVAAPAPARIAPPPGRDAIFGKPVSDLELSVRARRCLQRLNIQSLGDLVQLTEADLLATRNFGATSLNEIRARLADHGLALATKRPD